MDDVHGFFDHALGAVDLRIEILSFEGSLLFQGREPDVDSGQCLGDHIMQLTADFQSFILLRADELLGQSAQFLLHFYRFFQLRGAVSLALFQRLLLGQ